MIKKIANKTFILQGCTNHGRKVFLATKFYMLTPNVCESSVWNMIHVTLLEPGIVWWLLDAWKTRLPWRTCREISVK